MRFQLTSVRLDFKSFNDKLETSISLQKDSMDSIRKSFIIPFCYIYTSSSHFNRDIEKVEDFLSLTTSEDKCVVHFYHEDFRRCAIMDGHLEVSLHSYDVTQLIFMFAFSSKNKI
jgi:hypothetical protein